jgi:hypothetical protein
MRSQRNHDQMSREWQKILLLLRRIGNASRQIMRTELLLSSSELPRKRTSQDRCDLGLLSAYTLMDLMRAFQGLAARVSSNRRSLLRTLGVKCYEKLPVIYSHQRGMGSPPVHCALVPPELIAPTRSNRFMKCAPRRGGSCSLDRNTA